MINIKKLIREHNIESDHNLFKLKTKSGVAKGSNQQDFTSYYIPETREDTTLVFESRFESGNLLAAMKVSDAEYDLVLQNDINTNGHT